MLNRSIQRSHHSLQSKPPPWLGSSCAAKRGERLVAVATYSFISAWADVQRRLGNPNQYRRGWSCDLETLLVSTQHHSIQRRNGTDRENYAFQPCGRCALSVTCWKSKSRWSSPRIRSKHPTICGPQRRRHGHFCGFCVSAVKAVNSLRPFRRLSACPFMALFLLAGGDSLAGHGYLGNSG